MELLIANTSNLLAQAPTAPGAGGGLMAMLIPFGLMFLFLYLLIIRPQRKKEQERQAMINSIKKNDHVLTSGGIYGIVLSVKDKEVTLKIDEGTNTKVRIARSAIVGIEKSAEE